MIKEQAYPLTGETIYSETLANGLKVHYLPKTEFNRTYALFSTNYGSIDQSFIPRGQKEFVKVPDGIAHFLEHKMFEKESGDVFHVFGEQGAFANAFTSYTRTSYLFSATDQIEENVETLLDFVQAPYFTAQTVEKEKGIIEQEIQMYEDDPYFRSITGLLANLYPNHPVGIDILGTVESIYQITADDLYLCYENFYHPSNMNLFVVGNFEVETMAQLVRENQERKTFPPAAPLIRATYESKTADIIPEMTATMDIVRPKALLGLRSPEAMPTDERARMKKRLAGQVCLQLLFGPTSQAYLEMYNSGLIDETFSYEFVLESAFHYAAFGGDSAEPKRMIAELKTILEQAETSAELTQQNVDQAKRKLIGRYFQSLNSLEYIANQYAQNADGALTIFDKKEIIEDLTLADVQQFAREFITSALSSTYYLLPEQEEKATKVSTK